MNKVIAYIFISLTLAGCASAKFLVPLEEGTNMVRKVQPDWKNECKFLGMYRVMSEGHLLSMPKDLYQSAGNKMLNKVVEVGGNAYLKTNVILPHISTKFWKYADAELEFEVFKCPVKN